MRIGGARPRASRRTCCWEPGRWHCIAATRSYSFRFSDGSFALHAPFWITWPRNYFRVLWIWGLPGAGRHPAARDRALWRSALVALAWIGIGLAPYSFLTYSTQIPSRQTYLASAGLALLFGLAMAHWQATGPGRRRVVGAIAALVLLHNVGYLWTKKRSQFLERAAPTGQLIALARRTPGPDLCPLFPAQCIHCGGSRAPGGRIRALEPGLERGRSAPAPRDGGVLLPGEVAEAGREPRSGAFSSFSPCCNRDERPQGIIHRF